MNKKTKFRNTTNWPLTIVAVILYVVMLGGLIYALIYIVNAPIKEVGFFQTKMSKILPLLVVVFFIAFLVSGVVGSVSGFLKGKKVISKENEYVKKYNPYLYYRELPNTYGIGVTSLLFDSTIENHKDIVAVILDLCAKKYLNLKKNGDKYVIKVLKKVDNSLLSNEKYILYLIINNNIKNLNYHEWYNYCMQDGVDLGLYKQSDVKLEFSPYNNEEKIKEQKKKRFSFSITLSLVFFILVLLGGNILLAIWSGILGFGLSYIVMGIFYYIGNLFSIVKSVGNQSSNINYYNEMSNKLTRTSKGVEELQKLYSFKAFINDFGHFVDKKPEEVILWDYYLAYAQVFGLTEEIMKSGYKEIIDNSSFCIDSIDDVKLDNVEVQ